MFVGCSVTDVLAGSGRECGFLYVCLSVQVCSYVIVMCLGVYEYKIVVLKMTVVQQLKY